MAKTCKNGRDRRFKRRVRCRKHPAKRRGRRTQRMSALKTRRYTKTKIGY